MPSLFAYQAPHSDALIQCLAHRRVALDASDLGTGKTVVACAIAKKMGLDLLVVGKKIMKPTWAYWMDQWGVSGIVGNWELARRRGLPQRRNTLYVFDECHEAGGYKTLNAKLLVNTYEARLPMLLLSATAIESPLRMWAIGYLLGFHNLKDFYRWGFKNGVKRNYGYPGFHFDGNQSVLYRINDHIFSKGRGSRMRKALIPDFPECQYMIELVEIQKDDRLAKWFGQIEVRERTHELKMAEKEAESDRPWANEPTDTLSELLFARMRAELAKVPALVEEALSGVQEGLSVVIFVNFLPVLDALRAFFEAAEVKTALIYGEQPMPERNAEIRRFGEDRVRILISTIDSGGAGIDLHDTKGQYPRLALVCPTWRATTLRQALGRVHRSGGKTKSLQKLFYAAGTIEEEIAARVRGKLDQIDLINDADLCDQFASVASLPTLKRKRETPGGTPGASYMS